MGKGDRKSRKGKIFKGSYGKTRLANSSKLNKPVAGNVKPVSEAEEISVV
jgi:ribosomal small subunit protein bTHX